MHIRKSLTIAEGLAIQQEGIDCWAPKLSLECLDALLDERDRQNKNAKDCYGDPWETGYDVWRGQDISTFIENWNR